MKIQPPADDLGLQRLKRANSRTQIKQVDGLDRSARIAPSPERRESTQQREQRVNRIERRAGQDRRRQKQKTILDTRSPHERRTQARREKDRDRKGSARRLKPGGIDETV